MNKMDKNIDDIFRERLGNHTETPPPGIWNAIQNNLGEGKTAVARFSEQLIRYILISTTVVGVTFFAVNKLLITPGTISMVISQNIIKNQTATPKNNMESQKESDALQKNIQSDKSGKPVSENATALNNNSPEQGTTETGNQSKAGEKLLNNDNGKQDNNSNSNKKLIAIQKASKVVNNSGSSNNTQKPKRLHSGKKTKKRHDLVTLATAGVATDVNAIPGTETVVNENKDLNSMILGTQNQNIVLSDNKQADDLNTQTLQNAIKTFKDDTPQIPYIIISGSNGILTKSNKKAIPPFSHRFEIGIKGGYEFSESNLSNNFVLSPYIQLNLSNRFALLAQPGIKLNNVNMQTLHGVQSFYKVNNDGQYSVYRIDTIAGASGEGILGYIRNYQYTQTHDSIVKSYSIGGKYISYELPVLLKCILVKHLSIVGGVNISYNSFININKNAYTTSKIVTVVRDSHDWTFEEVNGTIPRAPSTPKVIPYTGTPISGYKGPLYPSPKGSVITYGYMLGFSYDFLNRFMVDALVQKSSAPANVIGGYNINSALSSTYWRFMVGYRIY